MAERRARRTRDEVERAIVEATLAELDAVGYHGLTFEGVARSAHVSKHVLYRRHASRASLALSALSDKARHAFEAPPATGNLRRDLLAWLAVSARHAIPAEVARGIVGDSDVELSAALSTMLEARTQEVERHILAPARDRGDLPAGSITSRAGTVLFVILRDRALFGPRPDLTDESIVDDVLLPLLRDTKK